MHGNEMSTNVEFALDNLKYRKDGKFDFEEFKGMHHLYPSVLFPAFRSVTQCLFLNVSELQLRVDGVGAAKVLVVELLAVKNLILDRGFRVVLAASRNGICGVGQQGGGNAAESLAEGRAAIHSRSERRRAGDEES